MVISWFCAFVGSWFDFYEDRKGRRVPALDDNDATTCLVQDPKTGLLAKTALSSFSSLIVTVVSNQDYPDAKNMCVKSLEQPWLLMTHVTSFEGSNCNNTFCGPLRSCVYTGAVTYSDTLFWHQLKCDCSAKLCNELALHVVPNHPATLSVCDVLYT